MIFRESEDMRHTFSAFSANLCASIIRTRTPLVTQKERYTKWYVALFFVLFIILVTISNRLVLLSAFPLVL